MPNAVRDGKKSWYDAGTSFASRESFVKDIKTKAGIINYYASDSAILTIFLSLWFTPDLDNLSLVLFAKSSSEE